MNDAGLKRVDVSARLCLGARKFFLQQGILMKRISVLATILFAFLAASLSGCGGDSDNGGGGNLKQFAGWWEKETPGFQQRAYLVFDVDEKRCVTAYTSRIRPDREERLESLVRFFLHDTKTKSNSLHAKGYHGREYGYTIEGDKLIVTLPDSKKETYVRTSPTGLLENSHAESFEYPWNAQEPLTDVDGAPILRLDLDKNNKLEPLELLQPFVGKKKLAVTSIAAHRRPGIFIFEGVSTVNKVTVINFTDDKTTFHCTIYYNEGLLKLSKVNLKGGKVDLQLIEEIKF